MPNDQATLPQAGVIELVSGIINDVHLLTKQQLALFRHEIKGEIGHAREAGSLVAVGLAIVAMGSVLLCAMLVHLLARMAPDLPVWGCYGIVGSPIAALGAILCLVGVQRFKYIDTPSAELVRDPKERADG